MGEMSSPELRIKSVVAWWICSCFSSYTSNLDLLESREHMLLCGSNALMIGVLKLKAAIGSQTPAVKTRLTIHYSRDLVLYLSSMLPSL